MLRSRVICAALLLLFSGAAPPLALAAGNPPPRTPFTHPSTVSPILDGFRSLVAFLGLELGTSGTSRPALGHEMDPNGIQPAPSSDSGHGIDPDGG